MVKIAECCCGKNSLEVDSEPEFHTVCHCDNCKKRTGSAFGISAYFKKENVISLPKLTACYEFYHEHKKHTQKRYFCSSCGTTLYWLVSTMPEFIGVAGGCFVQNPLEYPSKSFNHSRKCEWFTLNNFEHQG